MTTFFFVGVILEEGIPYLIKQVHFCKVTYNPMSFGNQQTSS